VRSLADDPRPAEVRAAEALLRARARRYANVAEAESAVAATVITFQRGSSRYGIALAELCEIRPLSGFCALPGARRAVPGVIHYRGELLTLVELTALLSNDAASGEPRWVLVSERAGERIGLMADEVLDVVELAVGAVHALPLTLGDVSDVFRGATTDGVLVIDAAHLFQTPQLASVL
jgi:chemotaxis signal transduction protein